MNDCPNADVRDLLPDLLHDRLDEATRAVVESHLQGCADCRAELALLRDVRASLRSTPALNLTAIAAAIPPHRAPAQRSCVGWRTAAAVTLLVAGGSSLLVMQRGQAVPRDSVAAGPVAVVHVPTPPVTRIESSTVAVTPPLAERPAAQRPSTPVPDAPRVVATPTASRELAMGGGTLNDLSDRELASLLKDIDSLDALPSTDVESVPISPIAPRRNIP
jgi:anti-sigma factor RsiW